MRKQMEFASKKNIPFVIFVGDNEIESNSVTIKNMATGEQKTVALENLVAEF